jgi:hypothetical protein
MIVNGFIPADHRVQVVPAVGGTFEDLFVADPDGPQVEVLAIVVVNTSVAVADFSLCHDLDAAGTGGYGKDNALYWDKPIAASETFLAWQARHPGGGISVGKLGALGVASSVADALTVTAYIMASATQERTVEGER